MSGACGVTRTTFWLAGALLISSVLYALDYSPSSQALTLLGGAVLGQGAGLLKSRKQKAILKSQSRKAESGNGFVTLVVVIFVILLTLASVLRLETGHTFEYRSHLRWSGPWDNPNIFGLLMGVGAVLAIGVVLSIFCMSRGDEARSSKSEIGNRKSEFIEPPHVVSYKSRMDFCLLACGCLVGFFTDLSG